MVFPDMTPFGAFHSASKRKSTQAHKVLMGHIDAVSGTWLESRSEHSDEDEQHIHLRGGNTNRKTAVLQ